MKKWWFGAKTHIDADKVRQKKQAKEDLRHLISVRDEEGYVHYVKALNPDVSKEDLIRLIELFQQQCESEDVQR